MYSRFRETLKDPWEIELRTVTKGGGTFVDKEFLPICIAKTEHIIDGIKKNWEDVIFAGDIDIQFFQPVTEAALEELGDVDVAFQSESSTHPMKGSHDFANIGFMAIRCNERSLHFFEQVLAYIEKHEAWDQAVVNRFLRDDSIPLNFTLFSPRFWSYLHYYYPNVPGVDLNKNFDVIPRNILLHHATGAEKLDGETSQNSKFRQMELVTEKIKHDSKISQSPVAILLRTHLLDDSICEVYETLRKQIKSLGKQYDLFLLVDNTLKWFNKEEYNIKGNIHIFNETLIHDLGYYIANEEERSFQNMKFTSSWFHGDYQLLHFMKNHPEYEHTWMIEYDVRYSGDWSVFFKNMESVKGDLLATYETSHKKLPAWDYWHRKGNYGFPIESLKKVFFPVIRLSKEAANYMDEKYKSGLWGYCEITLPTILDEAGFTIIDLLETTDFISRRSFVWRLEEDVNILDEPNKMHHPIRCSDY